MPNWENRTLFHGDNLDMMRGMDSGTVDLIATDPPFNKGRDFHATPDSLAKGASFQDRWSWKEDVHQEWVDQIQDDWPGVWHVIQMAREVWGDGMGAFLCFMGVRLIAMRRILKDTGSIYLHCDPTASHYLKSLMDAVFGKENFKNEIVWKRSDGHPLSIKKFDSITDSIFFYQKSNKFVFQPILIPQPEEMVNRNYRYKDRRGRYNHSDLTGGKAGGASSYLPFRGAHPPSGRSWAPPTRTKIPGWAADILPENYENLNQLEKCEALDKIGLVYWSTSGKPYFKRYLPDNPVRNAPSLWDDIKSISKSKQSTKYPTQKPLALYERIIKASSNPGDIVLDPFCGCATTCVAAERLGRQWVGMDIWDGAGDMVVRRIKKECALEGPDGPRQDILVPAGKITYSTTPPTRTDAGETAVPYLKPTAHTIQDSGPRIPRSELLKILLERDGEACQGCGRTFDSPEYLEIDHKMPRADGGGNGPDNRVLLCAPCNRTKSHTLTLSGLRRANKKRGFMPATST